MRRTTALLGLPLALALCGSVAAADTPRHRALPRASSAAPVAAESPRASSRGRGGKTLRGTANLNLADEAVLELLPGVGEVTAARIVEHRKAHPFRKVDELTKVKGIGRKKLARLRPFLSVSGPTTLVEENGPSREEAGEAAGAAASP